MNHANRIVGIGLLIATIIAAADYAYYKGFDDGADASLCVTALSIDGPDAAHTSLACRNIAGKKPLPRIFPGTNGDEPTIWSAS